MSTEFEEQSSADARIIHRQLEHEDTLMVNRLSWLVASQSFLFTAYAIVLNGAPQALNTAAAARQDLLRNLLPTLGLATCGLIYLGVLAGVRVVNVLRRRLRQHRGGADTVRETSLGTPATHALGLAAPCCCRLCSSPRGQHYCGGAADRRPCLSPAPPACRAVCRAGPRRRLGGGGVPRPRPAARR